MELVFVVASLMALNALAIDIMLPALGTIAGDLGVANANDRQLIVIAYILGFGAPQLVFGPISDRYGRRPVIFTALAGYTLAGAACAFVDQFETLLAFRFLQGMFAAGCRVVAIAIVRDVYRGVGMARIMSLVLTVFMVVPIVAPSLGQAILFIAPWQWCFAVLAFAGVAVFGWTFFRLGETLERQPVLSVGVAEASADGETGVPSSRPARLTLRGTLRSYLAVWQHPTSRGYTLASGLAFGSLFAFISSSEQIFREVFHTGDAFALYFAGIAFTLSIASFLNSRLVERIGMRRMGHFALLAFTVVGTLLLVLTETVGEHLWLFFPLFSLSFMFFGMIGANFNSLAMEPLGHIAGTASAAYGFVTTTFSGVVGGLIGRSFDGSTVPLLRGFVALGVLGTLVVLVTERGRLFQREPVVEPLPDALVDVLADAPDADVLADAERVEARPAEVG